MTMIVVPEHETLKQRIKDAFIKTKHVSEEVAEALADVALTVVLTPMGE